MRVGNISPHLFVFINLIIALLSFYIFARIGSHGEFFFVPVLALAIIYGIVNLIRQGRGQSHFSIQRDIKPVLLLKKSIARYIVWLIILYAGYSFYDIHPYYKAIEKNRVFFSYLLKLYLILGLPYFFITLIFKSSSTEDFYDPAIRIIHIIKDITRRLFRQEGIGTVFKVFAKQYNRKVLLNIIMRGYFIPFMIIQVYANIDNAIRSSQYNFQGYNLFAILTWTSAILWLMDTTNASLSYCIESRWIENRSRSIDMTVGGWLVCLSCYAPMNNVTGLLFPFGPLAAEKYPDSILFNDAAFIYSIKFLEISALIAHVYADVSLGPSIANITFKRLQTRGLYGMIRHPGTTFKLLLWWVQSVFYIRFWSIEYLSGHLMWNVIYILRALTEERHLKKFTEYREYMKKVRYRFIPGIV